MGGWVCLSVRVAAYAAHPVMPWLALVHFTYDEEAVTLESRRQLGKQTRCASDVQGNVFARPPATVNCSVSMCCLVTQLHRDTMGLL